MSVEIFQSQIDSEVRELNAYQKEYQKLAEGRQKLIEQQHESELVKKEMDIVENNAKVYKLLGPALVRQDVKEVKANLEKRLDFIKGELRKLDVLMQETEKKMAKKKEKVKFQTMMKDMQMAMQNQRP